MLLSSVAPDPVTGDFSLDSAQMGLLPSELATEIRAAQGDEWVRGISYLPENATAATVRDPGDTTTVDNPALPSNATVVEAQPFIIETKFTCSTFGWEAVDFKGRAQRQNDLATPAAIEKEFWTGAQAQASGWPNNYLARAASVDVTPVAGTAVSITHGLALLQDALRSGAGGQGMIHCIPGAAPNLLNVRRQGKFLLDIFDNIVVPGVGYTGSGPTGAQPAAGTTWMYATDLVMVRVEREASVFPDTMAEAVTHGQTINGVADYNTVTFRAERFAVAYFDGFRQFAVLVNLPA